MEVLVGASTGTFVLGLFLLTCLASHAQAGCMVHSSTNYPPQVNCPASTMIHLKKGTCTRWYSEEFPYIPFPLLGTGVDMWSRKVLPPGAPIAPWSACLQSSATSGCLGSATNFVVTKKDPYWDSKDLHSWWISNVPDAIEGGPAGKYVASLILEKHYFDYSGVGIEHEGTVDDFMISFSCNGASSTLLPSSPFHDDEPTLWPPINDQSCPSLPTDFTTVIEYVFQNTGGPVGLKVNMHGNPHLRSSVVGYTDDCGSPIVDDSQSHGSAIYQVGTTTNTLTVIDAEGISTSCSYDITVVPAAPNAICKNLSVLVSGESSTVLDPSDIDGGSTAECDASITQFSVSPATVSIADVDSSPLPVTLTVVDEYGSTASCTSYVNVLTCTGPCLQCTGEGTAYDPTNGPCTECPLLDLHGINCVDSCAPGQSIDTSTAPHQCSLTVTSVLLGQNILGGTERHLGVVVEGTGGEQGLGVTVSFNSGAALRYAAVDGEGKWAAALSDMSSLEEGLLAIDITTDSAPVVRVEVVLDLSGPIEFAIERPERDHSLKASEASALVVSGKGESGATIALTISDGHTIVSAVTEVHNCGQWTAPEVDVSGLAPGTVTVAAVQTDPHGNSGPPIAVTMLYDAVIIPEMLPAALIVFAAALIGASIGQCLSSLFHAPRGDELSTGLGESVRRAIHAAVLREIGGDHLEVAEAEEVRFLQDYVSRADQEFLRRELQLLSQALPQVDVM